MIRHPSVMARNWTRRAVIETGVAALLGPTLHACGSSTSATDDVEPRLTARPGSPTITPTLGLTNLSISGGASGQLYVPTTYSPDSPAPLFVALHGAGGRADDWASYHDRAEARGMVFMAANSNAVTWDLLYGSFGPDVSRIDRALQYTFDRCRIDAARIVLGGFSDGASYALSLGVPNGDLFTHLIGYSPGILLTSTTRIGKPRVFISHGTNDTIIPVAASRDSIVPFLQNDGYDVTYDEFDGGHTVPPEVSESALDWIVTDGQADGRTGGRWQTDRGTA